MWSSRFLTTVCVRGETVRDTHFAFSAARRRPPCVEQGARRRLPSLEQDASSPATTSSAPLPLPAPPPPPPPPPRPHPVSYPHDGLASPAIIPPRPRPAASSHHRGLVSPPTPWIFPRSTLPPPSYCRRADRDARCWTRCGSRHLELDRDPVRRPHTVSPERSSQLA
uniref:Uncharacterized protein n=1 Tax=Triticum urartu TaxID=4572 RepID=A0A8R7UAM3_TRIUA